MKPAARRPIADVLRRFAPYLGRWYVAIAIVAAFAGLVLVPGIGTDHTAHAVAAAKAAGVRHIVYLSSYAVLGDPLPAMGRWHHQREQIRPHASKYRHLRQP